jgi:hypothetical protein
VVKPNSLGDFSDFVEVKVFGRGALGHDAVEEGF